MNEKTRTSNSIRNIIVAVSCQILSALLGFVTKTIFIKLLGDANNGLLGFFANIVSVLSLAELGLGTAITFALYKPIADNNVERLQSLMQFYKRIYTYIAGIVLVLGLCVLPFLHLLMEEVSSNNLIYLYYFIYLLNTVTSYLFIYKSALLNADQRNRIVRIVNTIYIILRNLIEIGVLLLTHSFIAYLLVQLCCTVLNNVTISTIANKLYPWLVNKAKALEKTDKKRIFTDVKSVVYYKIGGVLLNNTDNILITVILGVLAVGYYSNYLMITTLVLTVLELVFSALTGSVGNLNATTTKEQSKKVYDIVGFISFWIYSFCAICIFVLIDDAVLLWLGNQRVLESKISIALAINMFVLGLLQPTMLFRNTTTLFRKAKFIILITAGLNIVLSIGLGYLWGIAGIVFATAISRLLTNFWYEPYKLHKDVFQTSAKNYFIKNAVYILTAGVVGFATYFVANLLPITGFFGILLKLVICLIIPNVAFLLLFCRTSEFKSTVERVKSFLKGNKVKNAN
jgi:O-antigen/teichoic acid export membrane protein